MALDQTAQPDDDSDDIDNPEDIDDWMDRRKAQTGDLAGQAEALGRQFWNNAIRTGQNLLGRTQSELRTLGAAGSTATPPSSAPTAADGSPTTSSLDQSPAAKLVGGMLAGTVGQGAGILRGAWHSAQGFNFLQRLMNYDPDVWGSAIGSGLAAADYVRKGIADPASVGGDIRNSVHQFHVGIDPDATPMAATFTGELKRRYGIGMNQGELGWDIGALAAGSPALKAVKGLGALEGATTAAEFGELGFNAAQAERLAQDYSGVGHHSPISQSLAKTLNLPDWLRDSEFNVVKPDGMNQGDFYRFHYAVDPQFHGAGFSRKIGGGGWSGKRLGFQKYGPLGRFWYGTPTSLAGLSASAGTAGLLNYQPSQGPSQ